MLPYELDQLLVSLPIEYGTTAHKVEQARYAYEIAEANYTKKEASLILTKFATSTETNKTLLEKKAKYEVIGELFNDRLEVLKKRSTYRAIECDLETLDKRIMLLNKQADRVKASEIQEYTTEKAGSSLNK